MIVRIVGPLLMSLSISGCKPSDGTPLPLIYASVDPPIANSILHQYASAVRANYDAETNKTAGLVARLRVERSTPRADVFWNGEVARTIELCREGVLERGALAHLTGDSMIVDSAGCWIGFAARARVIIVRSDLQEESRPQSILDLVNKRWRGRAAIGNPHFGTTSTHFAALHATWGEAQFRGYIREMRTNEIAILPGNAQVKDAVAQGRFDWGLTDTDDVHGAMQDGAAVDAVFPDQYTELGIFLIPNTVALVSGGPNMHAGRLLAEYLTSAEVEASLAQGRGAHIPIRHNVPGPPAWPDAASLRRMTVSYEAVADAFPAMLRAFDEEWPQ